MSKVLKNFQVVGPFKYYGSLHNHANILIGTHDVLSTDGGVSADVTLPSVNSSHGICHVSIQTPFAAPVRYIEEEKIENKIIKSVSYKEDSNGIYIWNGVKYVRDENRESSDQHYRKEEKIYTRAADQITKGQKAIRESLNILNDKNEISYDPTKQDSVYLDVTDTKSLTWKLDRPGEGEIAYYQPRWYYKDKYVYSLDTNVSMDKDTNKKAMNADLLIKGVCIGAFDGIQGSDDGTFESTFTLSERGIIEFDLINGYNWEFYFLKDMPYETIVDIVWEYKE